jgi:hypothetical protein
MKNSERHKKGIVSSKRAAANSTGVKGNTVCRMPALIVGGNIENHATSHDRNVNSNAPDKTRGVQCRDYCC